jgi:hypothetical protein
MAGLKDKRGFIDKERLDLSERQAVEYWMKRWGVTREQLSAAHRSAGRLIKDYRRSPGQEALRTVPVANDGAVMERARSSCVV